MRDSTQEGPARPWRRVAVILRESMRGTPRDLTSGSLGRAVFVLAIPMVLEMAGESLFAVCDAFFVARLGAEALAAVGFTEALLELVYAIAVGLGMATTALVARRWGEGHEHAAMVAGVQAMLLGAAVAAVLGLAGGFAAPQLLTLLGASPETVAAGSAYTRWMLGGQLSILLLFVVNAVFRGAGDAGTAMRALWVANGVNLVLDPCLIFGLGPFPELGLQGAAVATNIGRSLGVVYGLRQLATASGGLRIRRRDLRLEPRVARALVQLSYGGIGQMLVATASWIGLVRILAVFGSVVLAGYVLAIRIVVFVILPSWGLSNAAATLVGQNLGAARPARAERSVFLTGIYNMVFMAVVTAVFLFGAGAIVRRFTDDPAVLPTAADCLRIISYGYVFYAWGMVTMQAFNGAGDTRTPTLINIVCFWMCQIPLAYFLSRAIGPNGVFWAIAVSYSLSAVVGLALFRRGRWKQRQV